MSEHLLEEFLEGARRFGEEVSFDSQGISDLQVKGAIFDRPLSMEELEVVEEFMNIG